MHDPDATMIDVARRDRRRENLYPEPARRLSVDGSLIP
jgi:hypothetical protein